MEFESFECLFDALAVTLADAPSLKARFALLSALENQILSWSVPRKTAATRLGITSSKLNHILQYKFNKFTLNALMDISAAASIPESKIAHAP